MEITIERRKVCADPASEADVLWIFEQFEREDAWRTFGYAGPAMAEAMFSYVTRDMVLAVIRRAGSEERVGFVVLFPPHEGGRAWELGYVVEPAHRDAFTAIWAADGQGPWRTPLGRHKSESQGLFFSPSFDSPFPAR